MTYEINTNEMAEYAKTLRAGDDVSLSGIIYTARDAAHLRLIKMIEAGEPLPFELRGATIYYAGPTVARPGAVIGACGPTTSKRMDGFAPKLIELGLSCTIGKGERGPAVTDAMKKYGAVYLAAIGGAGALIASRVKSVEVVAFPELGCESIKRLAVENFPAIVAQDCAGGSLYGGCG